MTEELKTIETVDTSPFKHLVMTIGELPTSFVESMTYYECLAWLVDYIKNTVIPAVNNNGEAVEELQGLYTTLYNYVHDYFENLDVQEEINNKLDQMTEDGTLQNIIITYLGYVTPEMFGAVGDGTTDDSEAISDAIASANTDKLDLVFNPEKVYAVGSTIEINLTNKCKIDFNHTTIKALTANAVFKIDTGDLTNEQNGFFKNLIIDLNNIGTVGIDLYYCWRIVFEDIQILNIPISGIGVWVSGRKFDTNKSGGNLFNNVRGSAIGEEAYTSASEYNTFILIDAGDNTFSNIDWTRVKRGIDVNSFSTFSNVHGFAAGEQMYIGSYFMKVKAPCIMSNMYPDTQQFGFILDSNYSVLISNCVLVFNNVSVPSTITDLHPSYGFISTASNGGKLVKITGLSINTTVQKFTLTSNATINGTSYYVARPVVEQFDTSITSVVFDDRTMTMRSNATGSQYFTIKASANNKIATIKLTCTQSLGENGIQPVVEWYDNIYFNYTIPDGYYPAVNEKADSSFAFTWVRVNSGVCRFHGPCAVGDIIHATLPVVQKQG